MDLIQVGVDFFNFVCWKGKFGVFGDFLRVLCNLNVFFYLVSKIFDGL